ncbi:MAG: hypothetical protein U0359_20610 [Byssovorax sp.]
MRRPLLAGLFALGIAAASAGGAAACPGGQGAAPPVEPWPTVRRSVDVAQDDDGPVVGAAESALSAEAARLVAAGRWEEAAAASLRVLGGEAADAEIHRRIAEYHLALSFARLGYPEAALTRFAGVLDHPNHPRFGESLRAVIELAEGREQQERMAGYLDHVSETAVLGFDTPADHALYQRLRYLQGLSLYHRGHLEESILALEKLDSTSPYRLLGHFVSGASYIQLRKAVGAARSFFKVIEALDDPRPADIYLRDLAKLSLARTYYSSNHYIDAPCAPTIDGQRLGQAVKYYNRIPQESPLFPDALFESSWGYFMAGDYPHALGNLQSITSGYFAETLYPEVEILRGLIFYTVCRYEDALTVIARFERRYRPIRVGLAALLDSLGGEGQDEAVLDHLGALRRGRDRLPDTLVPFANRVRENRPVAREEARLAAIAAEEARLAQAPARLRGSALGAELGDTLRLARRAAARDLAARVRRVYQDHLDDLDRQLHAARTLLIDVSRGLADDETRRRLSSQVSVELVLYGPVRPDEEHVIWPFDGELWRDEVGTYRQIIESRCRRY